jgi:hypothetical protein
LIIKRINKRILSMFGNDIIDFIKLVIDSGCYVYLVSISEIVSTNSNHECCCILFDPAKKQPMDV